MWEEERLTRGPTGQRDPLASNTETGETLVAGETRRRRGLRGNWGHQRDPLTKADLPRCETLTLPSSRGLAGVNGGSAALWAIRRHAQPMLSRLRFTTSISESRGSARNKNGAKWWSREAGPRRRWARAELRRGWTARSSAMPPYPCSTVAEEVTQR